MWDIKQWRWFSANYLNARPLCFKMISDLAGHVCFNTFLISAYQIIFKATICYFHNFSVSLFSFSGIQQFHHLDGFQAIGTSSFFIFGPCIFDSLWTTEGPHHHNRHHTINLFVFVLQTNQGKILECTYESVSMALLHISPVLKWSGTCSRISASFSTVLICISRVSKWSRTCSRASASSSTALIHVFSVLKWLETYFKHQGFF